MDHHGTHSIGGRRRRHRRDGDEASPSRSRLLGALIGVATIVASLIVTTAATSSVASAVTSTSSDIVVKVRTRAVTTDETGPIGTDYSLTNGVKFQLYTDNSGVPGTPVTDSWATCTVTSGGQCTINVPDTNKTTASGGHQNQRFFVVQIAQTTDSPGTYSTALSGSNFFKVGDAGGPAQTVYYVGRTPALAANTTYNMPDASTSSSDNISTRSFGAAANSLNNPELTPTCTSGIRLAIVMDLSASISSGDRTTFRNAIVDTGGLFDALTGTGSSVAVFTFGTSSPAGGTTNYPTLLPLDSNRSTLNSRIQTTTSGTQYTNWDRAMRAVSAGNTTANHYDLVLFITDGAPNNIARVAGSGNDYVSPNGSNVTLRSVEAAIYSANAVKAANTRIVGVGVGAGVSGDVGRNLRAVSGPDINDDYFQTSNWTALKQQLENIAKAATCQVPITVNKLEIPAGGGTGTAANGWTVSATPGAPSAGTLTLSPTANDQVTGSGANVTGQAKWTMTFNNPNATASVAIGENATSKPGYGFVGGTCVITHAGGTSNTTNFTTIPVTLNGIKPSDKVDCTLSNQLNATPSWTVEKSSNPASGSSVLPGSTITYTLLAKNTGNVAITSATALDTLPAGVTYGAPVSGGNGTITNNGNGTLTWNIGTIAQGGSATISYTVTVKSDSVGSTLVNKVAPSSPNGTCVPGKCETTHLTPNVTVAKSVKKGAADWDGKQVATGDVLTWTITVKNNGPGTFTGEVFTDNLTSTLNGVTLSGNPTSDLPAVAVNWSSPNLKATATNLGSGVTATITYTGTVKNVAALISASVTTINNTVVPSTNVSCASDCTTENPLTPKWTVAKTANPVSGTVIDANTGGDITYTVTATNTGPIAIGNLNLIDDLSAVIQSGVTFTTGPTWTTPTGTGTVLGTVTKSGNTITGVITSLAPGSSVSMTYKVHVDAHKYGLTLKNAAYGTGTTPPDQCTQANKCETTHTTPGAPKLTLVKEIDKQHGTAGAATDWTLAASASGGAPGLSGATGTAGATGSVWSGVEYTLSETPNGTVATGWHVKTTWACTGTGTYDLQPTAGASTAKLTLQPGADVSCKIINTDEAASGSVAKTVTSTTQNADGTWTITYQVTVTNTSTGTATYTYDLKDAFNFGGGISIVAGSTNVAGPSGVTLNGAWNGTSVTALANNVSLPKATGTHTYTVTVKATLSGATAADVKATCEPGSTPGAGGFLNTATIYKPGTTTNPDGTANACSSPVLPTIVKTAGTPTQNADGSWNVTYSVKITNPGTTPLANAVLTDNLPAAPTGWTLDGTKWNVAKVGSAPAPIATQFAPGNATIWSATTAVPLLANTTYEYTVTGKLIPSASAVPTECGATGPNKGVINTATVTSSGIPASDDACTSLPSPSVNVAKTVTSTQQQQNGSWTITYSVVVTNTSQYTAVYSLADTLNFGGDITVNSASWTGPSSTSGSFNLGTGKAQLATNRPLGATAPGNVETYTVTVNATVGAGAWTGETPTVACKQAGSLQAGGFLNVATVTAGNQDKTADACSQPSLPTIQKTAGVPTQNADGSWNVTYTITLKNPNAAALADAVLTDDLPAAPTGWTLDGGKWNVAKVGSAPDPSATQFAPGNATIWSATAANPLPANTTYAYTVTGKLIPSASAVPTLCDAQQPGTGLINTATVTSSGIPASDDACTSLPAPGVDITKTVTSTTQNDDGTWQITYDVVVKNTSQYVAVYSLTDTLKFGGDITVNTATWSGATTGTFTGVNGTFATNRALSATAPNNVDTYTVTVNATVGAGAWTGETPTVACKQAGSLQAGGFLNVATVKAANQDKTADACSQPSLPTIQKTAATPTQDPATGNWTVTYTVSVTNPGATPFSDAVLTDNLPAAPTGWTLDGGKWNVAKVGSAPDPSATQFAPGNATIWSATAANPLPANTTYAYTVTGLLRPNADGPAIGSCTPTQPGTGLVNTATVTSSGVPASDDACVEIPSPSVNIAKTVTSTAQNADGTWTITYNVVVTNPSEYTAVYSLGDTLSFGGDITVNSASWTGPSSTAGSWDLTGGNKTAQFVTNRLLPTAPGNVETYTVTVNATVAAAAWTNQTVKCSPAEPPTAGGFLNTATVTAGGVPKTADDCSEPSLPTITKTGAGVVQDGTNPNLWHVSYTITVTPAATNAHDTYYTLNDVPGFPSGVTLSNGTAKSSVYNGGTPIAITADSAFPAAPVALPSNGGAHTWTVTWDATLTGNFDPTTSECGETPTSGHGFYNAVQLLQGGKVVDDDQACIPVDERVYPDVAKTVTSTQQDADGNWTITYEVKATLPAQGDDNPKGLSASYDLSDTLDFGGGIDVLAASWTGPESTGGSFDLGTGSAVLATDRAIAPGGVDTYTVTVKADVTAGAIEEETTDCVTLEGSPAAGGFLNTVLLTSGGQDVSDHACSEPIFPTIVKNGAATTDNHDGTFDLSYDVDVYYSGPEANQPAPVHYTVTDAPALPTGVELVGNWKAEAATGSPAVTNGTWNGTGTWTIVEDASFTAGEVATGEAMHTYHVTATVRVTSAAADIQPAECEDVDGFGIVVPNVGTITSGNYVDDSTGCQVVEYYPPNWTLEKTSDPASGTPVGTSGSSGDSDHTIVYTLTAYNQSHDIVLDGAVALDTLPPNVTVTDDAATLAANGLTLSADGKTITWNIPSIPRWFESEGPFSASVSFTVNVEPGAVNTSPLVNVAKPTTPGGRCETDDSCTTTHPVKQLHATSVITCASDAIYLNYSFTTVNVPNASSLPVTLVWKTQDGTVVRTDTIPAGQTSGTLLWPGTTLNSDGVAIGWPGWRDLQPSDYPLPAGAQIYGTQIRDTSIASNVYRQPLTLTFTMNPSDSVSVVYPEVTPSGCPMPRDPNITIVKTASATTASADTPFTYTISVANTSTLGVAYPVKLSDPIPASLRITGVETDTSVNPHWVDCALTGADAGGYGGTLNCTLNGPLGTSSSAPAIVLTAVPRTTGVAGNIVNTATACASNPSNPSQPEQCVSGSVPIELTDVAVQPPVTPPGELPATGGRILQTLALAALVLGLGWFVVLTVRRRRRLA